MKEKAALRDKRKRSMADGEEDDEVDPDEEERQRRKAALTVADPERMKLVAGLWLLPDQTSTLSLSKTQGFQAAFNNALCRTTVLAWGFCMGDMSDCELFYRGP